MSVDRLGGHLVLKRSEIINSMKAKYKNLPLPFFVRNLIRRFLIQMGILSYLSSRHQDGQKNLVPNRSSQINETIWKFRLQKTTSTSIGGGWVTIFTQDLYEINAFILDKEDFLKIFPPFLSKELARLSKMNFRVPMKTQNGSMENVLLSLLELMGAQDALGTMANDVLAVIFVCLLQESSFQAQKETVHSLILEFFNENMDFLGIEELSPTNFIMHKDLSSFLESCLMNDGASFSKIFLSSGKSMRTLLGRLANDYLRHNFKINLLPEAENCKHGKNGSIESHGFVLEKVNISGEKILRAIARSEEICQGLTSSVLYSEWIPCDLIDHVVFIRLDHLGDVYLTLNQIKMLKEKMPRAKSTVVCGPWAEKIFRSEGFENVFPLSFFGENGAVAGINGISEVDKARLRSLECDLAIDFKVGEETREVMQYIPARLTAGYPSRFFSPDISLPFSGGFTSLHHYHQNSFIAERLPLFNPAEFDKLRDSDSKKPFSSRLSLSPSASMETKMWPLDRWIDLAIILRQLGFDVQLFGGPNETRICQMISNAADVPVHPIVSIESYPSVVAEVSDVYIGHDTGPTHGVAMRGVPVVEIMGGISSQAEWMAYGPNVITLTRKTSCSPCYCFVASCCPHSLLCLDVPVQDVLWAIGRLLQMERLDVSEN